MPFGDLGPKPGEGLAAPATAAATNGMVYSAAGLWLYPPGYLAVDDDGATYTGNGSTTPETSLLSTGAAIANGFLIPPAGSVKGDSHLVVLAGTILNSSGGGLTDRLRVYFGTDAIVDATTPSLTSNATARTWMMQFWLRIVTAAGAGAGSIRLGGIRSGIDAGNSAGTGWGSIASGGFANTDGAASTPASATNIAQSFHVTSTHSGSSASMTTKLNYCQVRTYHKNY
jgi:hypothetical protein